MSFSKLTSSSYLGAVGLKTITTASIFSLINYYINGLSYKDNILYYSAAMSGLSSLIAEMLMDSIINRLTTGLMSNEMNKGLRKIWDQGLNAVLSGYIQNMLYGKLSSMQNINGKFFDSDRKYQVFIAQAISDISAEILASNYLVELFGFKNLDVLTVFNDTQ